MGIAIFISCMGIFGLAAFTANQRTREICIRKILGAGVLQLVSLLSLEFILLVGLSIVIAVPLAGWGVHQWFQDCTCRGIQTLVATGQLFASEVFGKFDF